MFENRNLAKIGVFGGSGFYSFLEDIEEEDEKELESEMEHLITIAGEFYDREIERYEQE